MSPIQGEISHRKRDPRELLLLSAGKLFQDVGYVQASIYRIASAVNAPKGAFYNYFRSKEDLASRLVDRQFEALRESLSRSTGHSASHQLKEHCSFLAIEPPMVEVAPLQLLATLAAEAPAIPVALTQRIARGTDVWITRVGAPLSDCSLLKVYARNRRLSQPGFILAFGGEVVERKRFKQAGFEEL